LQVAEKRKIRELSKKPGIYSMKITLTYNFRDLRFRLHTTSEQLRQINKYHYKERIAEQIIFTVLTVISSSVSTIIWLERNKQTNKQTNIWIGLTFKQLGKKKFCIFLEIFLDGYIREVEELLPSTWDKDWVTK
jgi:PP-loop superfamily ATP-utilizing enzyme